MATEIDALPTSKSIGWTDALIARLAANSVGLGGRLSITAPANASALSSSGYSLTGSNASSMIDLAGTLNTTGSPSIIKVAMSNTASGATTKFLDFLAGATGTTSVMNVNKAGTLSVSSSGLQIGGRTDTGNLIFLGEGGGGVVAIGSSYHRGISLAANAALIFCSDIFPTAGSDLILLRDAANTLALRNSTNAQAFNIYNTYTSGSVYERGFMRWVSNVLEIGTEHVGASARRISFKVNTFEYLSIGTSTVDFGSDVNFSTASSWRFSSRAGMASPSDGVLLIRNNASTDFNRLQFGGTTSSFPALKRSSTVLQSRLADDSDFAPFAASTLALTTPVNTSALSSTGYSLTGSNASSMIDLAGTWNTTGTPTLIKANVTDTASNANSLLMDLQVGGSSRFNIKKNGDLTWAGNNGYAAQVFSYASGTLLFTGAGTKVFQIGTNISIKSDVLFGFTSSAADSALDTILLRDAANTLALRNSTNAQAFNIYNTYTSGSVYERMFARYSVANTRFEIGTEHTGASARDLSLMTNGTECLKAIASSGQILVNSALNIFTSNCRQWNQYGITLNGTGVVNWRASDSEGAAFDTGLKRTIAGVVGVTNGSTGGGALGLVEITSPAAPATNGVYIFAEDNGGGKTRLMARFATGATQQLAIEP